jgi:hypothetical protein
MYSPTATSCLHYCASFAIESSDDRPLNRTNVDTLIVFLVTTLKRRRWPSQLGSQMQLEL